MLPSGGLRRSRGKLYYFGPWSNPDAALQKFLDQRDDLYAGRTPRSTDDGLTVKDLCNRFLTFRLTTCCGLRVSEIVGLTLANVKTEGKRPHIYIPKTIGKGGKARRVPLWWDQSTLADLRA